MGYEKDRQIQQWEQGWQFMDSTICYRCLTDPILREIVKESADQPECSFCDRPRRKNVAIDFNVVMERIGETVRQYFGTVDDEGLGWDKEDERWFGTTYDAREIIEELGLPSDNERVIDEIVESLGDEIWCDRHPYSLTGVDRYDSSWDEFCNTVKHKIRYFFGNVPAEEYSETIPVSRMLGALRVLIEAADLVQVLDAGAAFYRVREHHPKKVCATWRELGPPPPELAKASRMSAAGISVFYAAFDTATARAETTLRSPRGRAYTCARWTSNRPLTVLDLTKLPDLPSVYAMPRYDRDDLVFLRHFVHSIAQPVSFDDKVHIDYVPTQIVTEYFRYRYRVRETQSLDGIVYPSAQHKGRSIVVFASDHDLNPRPFDWPRDDVPLLTLDQASIHRVRKYGKRKPGEWRSASARL